MKTGYLSLHGLLICLLVISCHEPRMDKRVTSDTIAGNNIPVADTLLIAPVREHATEAEVLDSLRNVPFVAASNRYIDSFSHHKQGIAFLIDTVSDKEVNFRAGYNGDLRFETYYFFTVNPQNFDIRIMEPVSGEHLTIAEYQKVQPQ
ncbi:hypothetical protein [Niabella drilacis]|uniref:Uncharacterized protein n=1 Tax=Niabella drilacis (strain DSM 25811 / CCM 8410 / CCUG 62505 / LMG 26954 / E90) TaxID=1285928 RepID=A0A1G6YHN6_NIADE|nr:hypothetical protein [Niabella drilacis]SDD89145.1 hypothetical protein SAMN04487894_115104 [Niabella drilacis]